MLLQRRGHGARPVGTVRSSASQSFEACTAASYFEFFPEPDSRFAVRHRLSGWCPTGASNSFSLVSRIIVSTGVNNNSDSVESSSFLLDVIFNVYHSSISLLYGSFCTLGVCRPCTVDELRGLFQDSRPASRAVRGPGHC